MSDENAVVSLTVGGQVSRRQAMQWVMAAAAASAMPRHLSAQNGPPAAPAPKGYGLDAPLNNPAYKPGGYWPLTLNAAQKSTATALADFIIPTDGLGPAASEVGVIPMLDEWISAPYPEQQGDRPVILEGLAWIHAESQKRFDKDFTALDEAQKAAICDDICFIGQAKGEFRKPASFFSRFRSICASAYYATPEGWKAIGFVGNVILPRFDGPPQEVLDKLGVTQTVK